MSTGRKVDKDVVSYVGRICLVSMLPRLQCDAMMLKQLPDIFNYFFYGNDAIGY